MGEDELPKARAAASSASPGGKDAIDASWRKSAQRSSLPEDKHGELSLRWWV